MNDAVLEEIAELLDEGLTVLVHRRTFEVLSYPHPERWSEAEYLDGYLAIKEEVEAEPESFVQIDPPPSKVSFSMMEDFAAQVADVHLRALLMDALHSRKPFRYFRQTVEASPQWEAWLSFKKSRLCAYALGALAEKWD